MCIFIGIVSLLFFVFVLSWLLVLWQNESGWFDKGHHCSECGRFGKGFNGYSSIFALGCGPSSWKCPKCELVIKFEQSKRQTEYYIKKSKEAKAKYKKWGIENE